MKQFYGQAKKLLQGTIQKVNDLILFDNNFLKHIIHFYFHKIYKLYFLKLDKIFF